MDSLMLRFYAIITVTIIYTDPGCGIEVTNLALGKSTYQSSSEYTDAGGSELAVDGNTNQYWSGGSCSHTAKTTGNYWEVDLGGIYVVDSVVVYNRRDACCEHKLVGVEIYLGFTTTSYRNAGYHDGTILMTHTFQMAPAAYARWVRITRTPDIDAEMMLCEVEVFGYSPSNVQFRQVTDASGTGGCLGTISAVSWIQCCRVCLKTTDCCAVELNDSICSLLDSDGFEFSSGNMIYKLG